MALLIKNAMIVNADGMERTPRDILMDKGRIVRIAPSIKGPDVNIIDAHEKFVLPGLIDIHVHLREPGREDKETIETGSRSAVKGGFTTIMCMPNTQPVIDNAMVIEGILREARRVGLVNIIPIGAITKGQKGEELVDMFELRDAGCLALSDDGQSVANTQLMRLALDYARMLGLMIVEHCQDPYASRGAVMNEGYFSTILGMKGDPGFTETVIVSRDIEIVKYLKTKMHFAHISLKRSLDLIRRAKEEGIQITCEVTPHHFTLTDMEVKTFDPNTKVNPPLRSQEDLDSLKVAIKDGVVDCIASDHAPHTQEDKEVGFELAPPGMIGLETSLGLAISELVNEKIISWPQLVAKMSLNPAKIMGLASKGAIQEGWDADITIVDPKADWIVKEDEIVSRSKNTPFLGRQLQGVVEATVVNGRVVYERGKAN